MLRALSRRWIGALAIAALSTWSSGAIAGPEEPSAASIEMARSLAKEGYERFKEGDYSRAVELLDRAYGLYQAPTLALLRARSLAELGKLVEASRSYEMAAGAALDASSSAPMRDAVRDAKSELAALLPKIPTLSIGLLGARAGVEVRLNGEAVPETSLGSEMLVNPGVYLINAIEGGHSLASERVTLEEGARRAVVLRLPETEGSAGDAGGAGTTGRGSTQRVAGWASIGLGAAGLAVGIGAGVHMMNKKEILDEACLDNQCPRSAEGDLDGFRAARVGSMIGYGVGLAGVGVGLALLIFTPSDQARASAAAAPRVTGAKRPPSSTAPRVIARPRVTPFIGIGSAGVKGAF
jgi:hypothetical protein